MLEAMIPFLVVLSGVVAGVVCFFSSVGRLLDAGTAGIRIRLFLRGEKTLRWGELKPGKFGYVLGVAVLSIDRSRETFFSNPADFILVLSLPRDKPLLEVVDAHVGIKAVRLPLGP